MRFFACLVTAIAVGLLATTASALWSVSNMGTWPKTWPGHMEPLRKQARSLRGSLADLTAYEIPFTSQKDFEAAWPHLLQVKSKGAPVVLLRGPNAKLGLSIPAGVCIHCPPGHPEKNAMPAAPIAVANTRERWLYTTYIELIVDGHVVDLNRIALPADTPILDERFNAGKSD